MTMRNQLIPALTIIGAELGIGRPALESHGVATMHVMGGWLVVREGCVDDTCAERLYDRVNARIKELTSEPDGTRRIARLVYACARLARYPS